MPLSLLEQIAGLGFRDKRCGRRVRRRLPLNSADLLWRLVKKAAHKASGSRWAYEKEIAVPCPQRALARGT